MKLKSLAVGMILPLIGTIALSTAPAASAAPATSHVTSHKITHVNPSPYNRRDEREFNRHGNRDYREFNRHENRDYREFNRHARVHYRTYRYEK